MMKTQINKVFVVITISTLFYTSLKVQAQMTDYIYQSYQRSITCTSQFPLREPRSLSEIQDIVRYASARNLNVKPIGQSHSVSDIICTDGIPVKLTYINHFYYNSETQTAIGGAGMTVGDFLEKMHQFGRGITGPPSFAKVTLGGAVGTGVHGTGLRHPTTISQQIVSVTVVDGRGQMRRITSDQEDFRAFRVNLGLLGIIYEIEIATQPQFKLHIRNFLVNDGIFWNGTNIAKIAREHDHFQFWWFPTNKQIVLGIGSRVPIYQQGNCETRYISDMSWLASNGLSAAFELFQATKDDVGLFHVQSFAKLSLFKEVPGREPFFVEDDGETACLETSIGYGHRMTSNGCEECAWEQDMKQVKPVIPLLPEDGNILIPLDKLMPAMRSLGEMFEKQLSHFPLNGVYVRFVTGGDGYMAFNGGDTEWASIEWVTVPRWDRSQPKIGIATFQAMGQHLVEQYGGRPHWAKNGLYYTNPTLIRQAYPNLDKFIAAMNTYDPNEIFLNTFGERLKYGRNRYTISSEVAEHCALNEACICQTNHDCGNEGPYLDYTCEKFPAFPKYNVCLPGSVENMKSSYSRSVIAALAALEYNEDSIFNYLEKYKVLNNVFLGKKRKFEEREVVPELLSLSVNLNLNNL